ncbi:MAG TPA: RNA polymerase sigma factor [Rhodobacteraceae bacterium]|jgi:RNA polymerase sigma-70 factor (ECF subfamily)|nr:RNA polymerase sigma factor [Paracoccaceae bacterium]HBG97872.1 RNA polymerase sigma factor [Paracoccaceae bacterium]
MNRSDEALVRAAAAGDRAAFAALVRAHYDRTYRMAAGLLRDPDAAADIAQDIWASMPARLAGFAGEAAFTTWLYRVVLNRVRDHIRRTQRRAGSRARLAEEAARLAAEAGAEAERRRWLLAAFDALAPPELRETAWLIVVEGLTQAEAAAALDVAPGTVAWRMSEVKRQLTGLARSEGVA